MDRSWTVVITSGTAGPSAAEAIELGRSDADKNVILDIACQGTGCFVLSGRRTTAECQQIIGWSVGPVVANTEVIATCGAGGRVEALLSEDVREITVYFLANAPATPAGITLRAHN